MSLLRHQTLMMAALMASASLPARPARREPPPDDSGLKGHIIAVDDAPPVTASTYRMPIRGARLSLSEARAVYATSPADQARVDAAAERRARRQARNLRAAGAKP